MSEEQVKQDGTFTPGWGMRVGRRGVVSCPGGAGTASPRGTVCGGQVFHGDAEYRLGFSDVFNLIGLTYQGGLNLVC